VHDAVAVALEGSAHRAGGLGVEAFGARLRLGCVGRQGPPWTLFGAKAGVEARVRPASRGVALPAVMRIPGLTRGPATLCFIEESRNVPQLNGKWRDCVAR